MKIKGYKQFLEAISGTELVGHMGPNYGEEENSPMKKLGMTDVIYSDIFCRIVTYDEYQDLYFNYLKKGGTPLQGFNLENLNKVLDSIKEARDYDSYVKTEDDKIIEEICKEVFQDFLTDYSMSMFFNQGLWIPKFHGWFSIYTWNSIKGEVGELANVDHPKCLQISILNEHWDQSLGRAGQDEIYLDEDSEIKFNQCFETLKSYLSQEIDLIDIKRTELIPTAWQIQLHIIYKD
jgi:hypothetical protein